MGMTWNWFKKILGSAPLNDDDIVVFVVGPTGSGKSTFVQAVTQAPGLIEIEHGLKSGTKKVQAVRCELTDEARIALGAGERKNIVFVDTPSFHTGIENGAEKEMTTWLKNATSRSTRVGTIYMQRIESDPTADKVSTIQGQLDTFSRSFPRDYIPHAFPQRLRCVFSYVDCVSEEKDEDHRKKFKEQLSVLRSTSIHGWKLTWNTSTHADLFVVKNDPRAITAWKAVEALFSSS